MHHAYLVPQVVGEVYKSDQKQGETTKNLDKSATFLHDLDLFILIE